MRTTAHDAARERELRRWPGVTVERIEDCHRHRHVVLAYGGQTRFVVCPRTTGDAIHGPKRHTRDIRRVCAELGAKPI